MRINVGCGQTPTKDWKNFDNSFSLYLSKFKIFSYLLYKLKILDENQYNFVQFCHLNHVEYGDFIKGLPIEKSTVEVLYSSHMFEHLDPVDAKKYLNEARRILRPGGIIRLAISDLSKLIDEYVKSRDADQFMTNSLLCQPKPRTVLQRLKALFVGDRNHLWMYDGESLCRLLKSQGFINVDVMPPGKTKILNPEMLNLNERIESSVYVEAVNP